VAVNLVMPILHAVVLLDQAIAIDQSTVSAGRDLDLICESLLSISLSIMNPDAGELLRKTCLVVSEKVTAASRWSDAIDLAQRTTVSPTRIASSPAVATIADFEFIKRISNGAYARVYLARKTRTGDIYAIKVIPKAGVRQKNEVRRVLAEKDILLNVTSPFMIKFFYSIIGEHNLYLVMEYLPGGDLYSVLENVGSLPEEQAKIYAAQIVSALEFLRSSRVIHRDLKPDNILVDSTGRLKLTDFGLSFFGMVDRSIGAPGPTFDDAFVGTPDYTSPEIVLSQSHTFTADYWALGALLFEFLVGQPPFHGDTPTETFQHIIRGIYPESYLKDFTPELRDIIRRLLCQDPDARLGSKSIEEIKSNPWFSGIDWTRVNELDPPFIPQLAGDFDTSYFAERLALEKCDETDILADIRASSQAARAAPRRESLLSLFEDEPFEQEESIEEMFSSVGVRQLQETTNENARQLRLRRSSFDCEDDSGDPQAVSGVEIPTGERMPRRRSSRTSFSPEPRSPASISSSLGAIALVLADE
jgi:serine/threonine protein kinase